MNLKEEYKKLLTIVKKTRKAEGLEHRNEDISKILGYTRTYISDLTSTSEKAPEVTEDHIKMLKLHFPYLSENPKQEGQTDQDLGNLQVAIRELSESTNRHSIIDERNSRSIERLITLLEIKLGVETPETQKNRNIEYLRDKKNPTSKKPD